MGGEGDTIVTSRIKCNYGAEMTALNIGHFAGSGIGPVPKYPTVGEFSHVQKSHKRLSHLRPGLFTHHAL